MNLPLLIFDGDCAFCRRWVARWKTLAADRVLFASSDTIAEQLPEVPATLCAQSVVLRLPDGHSVAGLPPPFRTMRLTALTSASGSSPAGSTRSRSIVSPGARPAAIAIAVFSRCSSAPEFTQDSWVSG